MVDVVDKPRGGRRSGAGRKPLGENEKLVEIRFGATPENARRLEPLPRGGAGFLINKLLEDNFQSLKK